MRVADFAARPHRRIEGVDRQTFEARAHLLGQREREVRLRLDAHVAFAVVIVHFIGIEATQQESIDQLQVVQDQLQTVRRLLASQQADTKKLAEQVNSLTGAIDGLRQSFAGAQAAETTASPSPRTKSIRARTHGLRNSSGKRGKPQG